MLRLEAWARSSDDQSTQIVDAAGWTRLGLLFGFGIACFGSASSSSASVATVSVSFCCELANVAMVVVVVI